MRAAGAVALVLLLAGAAAVAQRGVAAESDDMDRVAVAQRNHGAAVAKLCTDAKLPYPPREIFLRILKLEQRLEIWARENGPFIQLATYPFAVFSGELGPKRREGDRQIPEGLYLLDRFNPRSLFHLSLGINYPNASDRILGDPERPGFDIFIHGKDVSIGCVALGDPAIEQLYILAHETAKRGQREIPVHVFPAAMDSPAWTEYQAQHPEKVASFGVFWANLAEAYVAFEQRRLVPAYEVDAAGRYQLKAAR